MTTAIKTASERERELEDVLRRHGFVPCDIAACNCGSWHARYGLPERMQEIKDMLSEAGYPLCNENGNLVTNALREALASLPSLPEGEPELPEPTDDLRDVWMSAPKRVWLDIGEPDLTRELNSYVGKNFRDLDEVTWSEDNATGWGIPYVRGDLAALAAGRAEPEKSALTDALDRMDGLIDPERRLLAVGPDSATAKGSRADMALIRAALAAPSQPVGSARIQIDLTEEEGKAIADLVMAGDEPCEVTLCVGDGCEGHGLYAWQSEYPEEGASFIKTLAALTPEPAALPAEVTDDEWYDLASRHATAEWNGEGYFEAIKAVCIGESNDE